MKKPMPPNSDASAYKNEIARRMFIATADENYAAARWAFLNQLNVDFLWLGLHALEKYLKAILLMNGKSAKPFGHDIETLHAEVLKLHPDLSFGPLTKPDEVVKEAWRDQSMEDFIKRIKDQGDPNNQYML